MCLEPNLLLLPIGPIHGAYPVFKYLNKFKEKKKSLSRTCVSIHVPFDSLGVYPMTPFLIQNIYKRYRGSLQVIWKTDIHPQW